MTTTRLSVVVTRHRFLVLLVLGLLLYVPFLGLRDMWYPDEPDIGEVCRAMYDSGDWIAPRRMGEIWVDYPPMIYWAGTAMSHALGAFSEFALRLPNALAAIAMALVTAWFVSRWRDPWTGFWSGFLLLTFLQFAYEAVNYRPDVLFTLFIGIGMLAYAHGAGEHPKVFWRLGGFAALGLAMLSKGPLGLLLPGLVLTLWHGSRREWRRLFELPLLALVSGVIYLSWFVPCARAMGADSIVGELYAQSLARFVGETHRGHGQPFFYYFAQIWIDLLWWGPLLPFAIWFGVVRGWWRDRNYQLALWWMGTFMVFLSIAVTKRQVYMLPAYPAAALLLSTWISPVARSGESDPAPADRKVVVVYGWILAAIFAVLTLVMLTVSLGADLIAEKAGLEGLDLIAAQAERVPAAVMALLLALSAGSILIAARDGSARRVLGRTGAASIVLLMGVFGGIMPALNPAKTYRPQCEWIRTEIGDSESFGLAYPPLGHHKMGAFALYSGVHVELLNDRQALEGYLDRHPDSVVLVHSEHVDAYFAVDDDGWHRRILRDLLVGGDRYHVIR